MKKCVVLLFVVMLFVFGSNASASLTDGLVAYFPFNGNANDESGNGHNGTVSGATLTGDRLGIANSAYSFNGSSSKISAPASSALSVSQVTLAAWVNIKGYGGYGTDTIVEVEPSGITNPYYGLNLEDRSSATRHAQFYVWNSEGNGRSVMTTTTFNNSAGWHHIAAAFDGSTVKVYVDGALDNTEAFPHPLRTFSSAVIAIGYTEGNYGQFNGQLDDIRIYNRALSDSEIQQLYTGSTCSQSDLAAAYQQGYQAGLAAGGGSTGNQCAYYDFFTGTLKVPCFAIGPDSYWLDLGIYSTSPNILLDLRNFGK